MAAKILGPPAGNMANYFNPVLGQYNYTEDLLSADVSPKEALNFENCYLSLLPKDFSIKMAEDIIESEKGKFIEYDADEDTFMKYMGIEIIALNSSLAFMFAYTKKHNESLKWIKLAEDLLEYSDKGYFPTEYTLGFRYVLRQMKQYVDLNSDEVQLEVSGEPEKNLLVPEESTEGEVLPDKKSWVGVLALQFYFASLLGKSDDERIEIARKMMKYDPDYFEWPLNLYIVLRFKRRSSIFKTTEEESAAWDYEVKALLKATHLAPNHPFILLNNCRVSAEMCKRRPVDSEYSPFTPFFLGQKLFVAIENVEAFIRERSMLALKMFSQSTRVNIYIAEFFTVTLPARQRDFVFGKQCLEKALEINPQCSKIHHRMGLYYLNITPRNLDSAENHFVTAYEMDNTNFSALVDLINVYMRDVEKNDFALKNIFNVVLDSDDRPLPSANTGQLLFLKGCFYFMKDGSAKLSASEFWIRAYELNSAYVKFKHISYIIYKFRWPTSKISTDKILKFLENTFTSSLSDSKNGRRDILEKLILEGLCAVEQDRLFQERQKISRSTRVEKRTNYK